MGKVNAGRLAALRALVAIEDGGHAEDLLAELAPPTGPDRGLAWFLALGVLRRRGALDYRLAILARRGMGQLDAVPRNALRLGLFEASLARTPVHAAVDQAVELCRAGGAPHASGLVNAVLRKAVVDPLDDDPYLDLPPWLADRWRPYPEWVARLRHPAPICGVWKDLPLADVDWPLATLDGLPLPGSFILPGGLGAIDSQPGFADGRWWVMDPAAVAVSDMALEAAGPSTGRPPRILDACAAPGGKTFRLAARGAAVVAVDLAEHRLADLRASAARLGLNPTVRQHDWLTGPLPVEDGSFDVVLVDAPCTGLGTVRRHPEIRWRRLQSDPGAMALRQRPILAAAAVSVAPGGALVYAVCSPMEEEGEAVAGSLPGWTIQSRWSSVPPQGDEDAFQAFVLRRS